jgi:hypothetical protein
MGARGMGRSQSAGEASPGLVRCIRLEGGDKTWGFLGIFQRDSLPEKEHICKEGNTCHIIQQNPAL